MIFLEPNAETITRATHGEFPGDELQIRASAQAQAITFHRVKDRTNAANSS